MIQKKLPLTVLKGNIQENTSSKKTKTSKKPERISIKKHKALIKPYGFYKPITKTISINGTGEKI